MHNLFIRETQIIPHLEILNALSLLSDCQAITVHAHLHRTDVCCVHARSLTYSARYHTKQRHPTDSIHRARYGAENASTTMANIL